MTSWVLALPMNDIHEAALIKRVDPALIMAIVSIESGGAKCATRYEPHYGYLFKPETFAKLNRITENTEIIQQKTSWGLMQIMGGVARELKFIGPLVRLCEPAIGLRYGIDHLTNFIDKYGSIEAGISAYNQGGNYKKEDGSFKNQSYVDKIMERYYYLKGL